MFHQILHQGDDFGLLILYQAFVAHQICRLDLDEHILTW
jgi:hypothetical protein